LNSFHPRGRRRNAQNTNDFRQPNGERSAPGQNGGRFHASDRNGDRPSNNRGADRFPSNNRTADRFSPNRNADRAPSNNRGADRFASNNANAARSSSNRNADRFPTRNGDRRFPPGPNAERFASPRGEQSFPQNPSIERASFGANPDRFARGAERRNEPRLAPADQPRFAPAPNAPRLHAERPRAPAPVMPAAPRPSAERPRAPAPDNRRPPLTAEREAAIEASPFRALGLSQPVVRALIDENYAEPTPVQGKVIPGAAAGRDVLASAQTGTGKTAAFVLPILHQLAADTAPHEGIQALVLTPTRELAAQIAERVSAYGRYLGIRYAVVYGGVSQFRQERSLGEHPRLLVATPGRLLDLMQQGLVRLGHVRHFVLDEADRMLDMGFIHDVRRIIAAVPKEKQTLLFSATVPRPIESLAQGLLRDPVRVDITPAVKSAETVEQSVVFVQRDQKSALLERLLQKDEVERAIVFTRTKHGANRLSQRLEKLGIGAPALHGNKSQNARERALAGFRGGKTRILVATDIAARGIDVDGISHVINFDLPNEPESYVHRVGRTGRAGARGQAISFCDKDERVLLKDIERLLQKRLSVVDAGVI
jgi:ATP-dependent RNA helicase RhlE